MKNTRIFASVTLILFGLTPSMAIGATIGKCKFDTEAMSFAGSPIEQASCLLRRVRVLGQVDQDAAAIPQNLSGTIGRPINVSKSKLREVINLLGLTEAGLGGSLDAPISRGNSNNPDAPVARYFVIHDTSTPNLGDAPFPDDLDFNNRINRLDIYKSGSDAKAHVFLNRRGETYVGHDFSVPWRATKLELKVGTSVRGMFLHIENVQPRRKHRSQPDGTAPEPGFSTVQYSRLALLYLVASARAGTGLVPAFHAALDEGFPDGHDDPQNFRLSDFDAELGQLLSKLR